MQSKSYLIAKMYQAMRHPAWYRIAGAGMLALLMSMAFGSTAFAKGMPPGKGGVPSSATMQPDSTVVDTNTGLAVAAIDREEPAAEVVPAAANAVVSATEIISADVLMLAAPLLVADVMPDSPAAEAGVAAGDLIVQIDDMPVGRLEDLVDALAQYAPGEVVTLTVQRDGPAAPVIIPIRVTLGAAPDDPERAYLGIRFVTMPSSATIEIAPSAGLFTAPAIPAPALPPMMPGYACGYPAVEWHFHAPAYAMPHAAPYALPGISATPAIPMMSPAPIIIYRYGYNPEVYSYGVAGDVEKHREKNVIFYRGGQAAGLFTKPLPPAAGAQRSDVIILQEEPHNRQAPVLLDEWF